MRNTDAPTERPGRLSTPTVGARFPASCPTGMLLSLDGPTADASMGVLDLCLPKEEWDYLKGKKRSR